MTYSEQLLHPLWQKKRLEILERDDFTCQNCQDTEKTLHVHHKAYPKGKLAWEVPSEFLTTLCGDCHKSIETQKKELLYIIKDFSSDEYDHLLGFAKGLCVEMHGFNKTVNPTEEGAFIAYFIMSGASKEHALITLRHINP